MIKTKIKILFISIFIIIIIDTLIKIIMKYKEGIEADGYSTDKKYDDNLIEACKRNTELKPYPPPGFNNIITKRF